MAGWAPAGNPLDAVGGGQLAMPLPPGQGGLYVFADNSVQPGEYGAGNKHHDYMVKKQRRKKAREAQAAEGKMEELTGALLENPNFKIKKVDESEQYYCFEAEKTFLVPCSVTGTKRISKRFAVFKDNPTKVVCNRVFVEALAMETGIPQHKTPGQIDSKHTEQRIKGEAPRALAIGWDADDWGGKGGDGWGGWEEGYGWDGAGKGAPVPVRVTGKGKGKGGWEKGKGAGPAVRHVGAAPGPGSGGWGDDWAAPPPGKGKGAKHTKGRFAGKDYGKGGPVKREAGAGAAAGGAPPKRPRIPARYTARRVDSTDGMAYTQAEFVTAYGGTAEWQQAKVCVEKRIDPADGCAYTKSDFFDAYGKHSNWDAATEQVWEADGLKVSIGGGDDQVC